MNVNLEKGRSSIDIAIPDERVAGLLMGRDKPGLHHDRIRQIISEGIQAHCPDDISGKKSAVIIPDDTRLWARGDLFAPVIVQTLLDMGVAGDNIKIIIALGTHADIGADRFAQLAGVPGDAGIDILNSANRNQARLVDFGSTRQGTDLQFTREAAEADHIIIFGGVLHHLIAGFGGGRKYLLPGIAGYDSVQQNHALAIREDGSPHPLARPAVLDGNPIHEDAVEAADLFLADKTCTHVAIAANGRGDIFHCAVGPLHATFLDGCRQVDAACAIEVPKKADFAMISAGGHRTDGQLYQSTKALFNAVNVVNEGGEILFVAGCSQGVGNKAFAETLRQYGRAPRQLGSRLAARFSMPAYVAFRVIDILHRFRVTLVSDLDQALVRELGFHPIDDPKVFVRAIQGTGYVIPFAENILPIPVRPEDRQTR